MVLTIEKLAEYREALRKVLRLADGDVGSVKPVINEAFQECEDVFASSSMDPGSMVAETIVKDSEAQIVQDELDSGNIPAWGIPIANKFLERFNPSIAEKSIDESAKTLWYTNNKSLFDSVANTVSPIVKDEMIKIMISKKVQEAK